MRRAGFISVGTALTVLCLAAPSFAQGQQVSASLTPNTAGAQSTIATDASPGTQASSNTATPQTVILDVAQGLAFDGRSRSARCTAQQAQSFSCPEASRVGTGLAQFTVSGPFLPTQGQQFTYLLTAFLAPPAQAGDLAGIVMQATQQGGTGRRSLTGRLLHGGDPPYDLQLRADLGSFQALPGYTVRLDRVQLNIGARRTVKKVRHKRRHHRRIRIVTKTTYSLITNPAVCLAQGWPYRFTVQYADHADTFAGSLACAAKTG